MLNRSFYIFEWLIVNDSPEESVDVDILSKLTFDYKVINHKVNLGIHQARVDGLYASNGDIIHLLDQDDEISKEFYLKLCEEINNDIDVVVCNCINENTQDILYKSNYDLKMVTNLDYYLMISNAIESPGQCLIKKSVIPDVYYNSNIKKNGSDDLLLWISLLKEEKNFKVLNECLYIHKDSGENVSSSKLALKILLWK